MKAFVTHGYINNVLVCLKPYSTSSYATIEDPFYCPHCRLISQDSQLQELKATVESLVKEVMALKCTEGVVGQPNPELPPPTNQLKQQDSQQQLQQVTRQILKQAPATVCAGTQESIATEKTSRYNDEDRKFNVVIHRIEECKKGTPRYERFRFNHHQCREWYQCTISKRSFQTGQV